MKTIEIILNGKSAANPAVREAIKRLRAEGHDLHVHVTWEGGDAARFAAQFAGSEQHVVVAAGGDGTVNEVMNGLMACASRACSMAILPLGTANDLASSTRVPLHDPYQALLLAITAEARAVDVGRVNQQYFLNVASGGFGAEVTAHTPVTLKNALGGSAYALEAVLMAMHSSGYAGRIITPEKTYEGSVVMFAVGNGRQAGGGVHMTPNALMDDGLLDVMLIPEHEQNRFASLLLSLGKLKFDFFDGFHYLRTRQLTIQSERELQINLDGEPMRGNEFVFDVLPRALKLVVPADCPLLKS